MAGTIEHDRAVLRIAADKGGICTRTQLLDGGLTAGSIKHRVRAGILQPVGRGVYLVSTLSNKFTLFHRAVSLVPGGVISHSSAAVIHNFPVDRPGLPEVVHVTVPASVRRKPNGVVVHRSRFPPIGADVIAVAGLPVTAAVRTVSDLAGVVSPARLRHVVQTAVRDETVTVEELGVAFGATARRGVTGAAAIRALVAQFRPPWYDGRRGVANFAHPDLQLVLEADGRRWHRRDQDMAIDRWRDRIAAGHGWQTIRVTWGDISQRPSETANEIKTTVAARQALHLPRPQLRRGRGSPSKGMSSDTSSMSPGLAL